MFLLLDKYTQYKKLQKSKFSSLESTNVHWSAGQRRFIEIAFSDVDKDTRIMDLACGDGVGLREFKKLGFTNVVGVEFNQVKIKLAKKIGYPVVQSDMHKLDKSLGKVDIIYSSHTLEHSLYPHRAIKQFSSHLNEEGLLIVVIPYPDVKIESKDAHVAREILGSNIYDDAKSIIKYFAKNKFKVVDKFFDTFREPEIWLVLKKQSSKKTMKMAKFSAKLNDPTLTPAFYLNFKYR
jgi:SAM-dependent methyltransferase